MDTISDLQSSQSPSDGEMRRRVDALGARLAETLSGVVTTVPGRPQGPQALGRALDMTTVTASRLLKALGQTDPVAVLQSLPGPNPLRKMVVTARDEGCNESACNAALDAIDAFDELIRTEAGDRGALKAMLSAWLPQDRREFEAQRRQTIYKALAELDGVSCDLEVATTIVSPSEDDADQIDIISVKSLIGIDRIRPDAVVRLGTIRVNGDRPAPPRMPTSLDGRSTLRDNAAVRLDDFCSTSPAPFVTHQFGQQMQYALGPTGFGKQSKVDVVIAEANRGEFDEKTFGPRAHAYYFTIPEMPSRKTAFDLILHEDIHKGLTPELIAYDTTALGPAKAYDEKRDLDRRWFPEPVQDLGSGTERARILEFPRYVALLDHVAGELAYDLSKYRVFRVAVPYPLVGQQITLVFRQKDAS